MLPFHLAMPVADIDETIRFYTTHFNCTIGRQAKRWVDLDFYGHQVSFHLGYKKQNITNPVDGDTISIPHFGVIIDKKQWHQLHHALKEQSVRFLLEPKIRFAGQGGEQGTFFIQDPSGNTLEFKYFDDASSIFTTEILAEE